MDDGIGAGERVVGLAEVGQVGEQAQAVRRCRRDEVDVEDVVTVLAQVAHDPTPALAAAARDDDPHARHLLAEVWIDAPSGLRIASGAGGCGEAETRRASPKAR